MRLLSSESNKVKRKRIIKLTCLVMAFLMLLTACGESAQVTTKKKKKIIMKRRKSNSSSQVDSSSSENNTTDDFYFDEDEDFDDSDTSDDDSKPDTDEDEDEGEDLKKQPIKDNSFKQSTVPAAYSKLVWADEFNGSDIDASTWYPREFGDGDDVVRYGFDNKDYVKVKDGALHMYSRHIFDPYDSTLQYACATDIDTGYSMNYRFGYLEMCAKIPFHKGTWAAWWLVNPSESYCVTPEAVINDRNYGIEVDIFEIFSSLDTVTPNLHKWWRYGTPDYDKHIHTQWSGPKSPYVFEETENLSNEWHVYGYEWTPTYMAMYVDGKEYQRFDLTYNYDNIDDMHATYTNLQYVIVGPGLMTPLNPSMTSEVDASSLPFEYAIDWMRLYQNPSEAGNLIYTK